MVNKAAQELGRLGGKKRSEAKTLAAITNGQLGGRPEVILAEDLETRHGMLRAGARVRDARPKGKRWLFQLWRDGRWQWRSSATRPVVLEGK